MGQHKFTAGDSLPPIPTYEEATEGLLGSDSEDDAATPTQGQYRFPTIEQARDSAENVGRTGTSRLLRNQDDPHSSDEDSVDGLDRDFQEMEMMDVEDPEDRGGRRRLDGSWKGRFDSIRRRMGRFWTWRRPEWTEHVSISNPWPELPSQYTPTLPIIARLLGLFVLVGLGYAVFVFEILPSGPSSHPGQMFDPEGVRIFAQGAVDERRIRDHLQRITRYPHIAGTKGSEILAKDIRDFMRNNGMDSIEMDEHWVYMNWPKPNGRRVAIISPPELAWEARLEEESPYISPSQTQANTLSFHGYSRAGNVTGPLVYANYGSAADYQYLHDAGLMTEGAIALVRYGGTQSDRAMKVKAAEKWGFKGVLMYSDPAEDGFRMGEPWPKGRWRPDDSVERGSVALTASVVGDPLTPGWASTEDAPRISKDNNAGLVNIPSLPLAWRDAQPLLKALSGHGKSLKDVAGWTGGVSDIDWWTGDKTSPIIHFQNDQNEDEKTPIINVIGTVLGEVDTASQVIVGNHRDSWCFGSVDPGSGTAIMLEVIEVFNALKAQGWRPLRTIKFISWDAEEYNLVGSTEYVESRLDELRREGAAYLNVDVGVSGPNFRAMGSPTLQKALIRTLGRITDPTNGTLKDIWEQSNSQVTGLGAGSDYVAFQDIAGIPSLDIGFEGQPYPYHSCYETFEWMDKFGDPEFTYHKLLAQIWVLLILEVAQEPLLPLRLDDYANAVSSWAHNLKDDIGTIIQKEVIQDPAARLDFTTTGSAITLFREKADAFHNWEQWWFNEVLGRGGFETAGLEFERVNHNTQLAAFEKHLLDLGEDAKDLPTGEVSYAGIPGRTQYKHILFAPQLDGAYDEEYFPAVRDAVARRDWGAAQRQLDKAGRILRAAAEKLEP